jgi:hypothetical protein
MQSWPGKTIGIIGAAYPHQIAAMDEKQKSIANPRIEAVRGGKRNGFV